MKYHNEKAMLFHFLSCLNYKQTLEDLETEVGYRLGDFRFNKMKPEEILQISKLMWISLHGKDLQNVL